MKNFLSIILLISFIDLSALAQLNDRFIASGNPISVASAGAFATNVHVNWRQVQQFRTSSFNWNSVDARISANQSLGLRSMITLRCTIPIGADDSIPGTCAYEFTHNQSNSDNKSSWFPKDTSQWKNFITALVERYDGNGNQDMPGLIQPVTEWHIGQEWQRIWCSAYEDTSIVAVQEFVRYVNLTSDVIKKQQPNSIVSFAGIDTRHDLEEFYDGYSSSSLSMCANQNCSSSMQITRAQLAATQLFLANRRNVLYLLQNTRSDAVDIHQYGRWEEIPNVVRWLKEQCGLGNRAILFLEGGGPFCKACEKTYHTGSDTMGYLSPELVHDNASYVVYYFMTGLTNGIKRLNWQTSPEYSNWGSMFGDLDLLDINFKEKPSFYTYRYIVKNIFSRSDADTIVKLQTNNPSLHYYLIDPGGISVFWSLNNRDTLHLNANGNLFIAHIPTMMGDSIIRIDTIAAHGNIRLLLNDGVPVFISGSSFVLSDVNEKSTPDDFYLGQNYPNPFSESTMIDLTPTLSSQERVPKGRVRSLKVYDLFGREVLDLSNQKLENGQVTIHNSQLPHAGMYFYRFSTPTFSLTKSMMVIK